MTAKAQLSPSVRQRQKRKAGTIAIPFLITILLSMLALGGVGYYYFQKLTNDEQTLVAMPSATTSISEDDIHEILFVLQPDRAERQLTVMLLRFDPVRKTEHCIGIPNQLCVEYSGQKLTVAQCLERYGVPTLRDALGQLLDQKIDRYISMNSTGFQKFSSIFGNVSCVVTIRDEGLEPSEVSQMLDANQLETLLTSAAYYNESERNAVVGIAIAQLINQCNAQRIAANLDGYFSAVVNATTTDITAMDFSAHRHAIAYVFDHATAPAKSLSIVGTEQNGMFVLSDAFPDALKVAFSQKVVEAQSTTT